MLSSSWLGCSGHLMTKEKCLEIDFDETSPGGRKRKIDRERKKIVWKTRQGAGLYMLDEARKEV